MRPKHLAPLGLALLTAAGAAAQDSVTVVAGARYEAGGLRTTLLGTGYRAAWTAPVRVPVLDPDRYAGGLRIIQRGGGLSTESLRMQGADGRQYVFRSVDKNAERGLPEDLQRTVIADAVQDAVNAKHPAAALLVPPMARALGLLHAVPTLYVMPDHPFLGEHRADFAGVLGQVEERPEEAGDEGGPGFAGAERVSGSDAMLERLEDDPAERLATEEYLRARLLDMVIGDWDRHLDQWRWARIEQEGGALWRPIPRDRDNALSRHGGLLLGVARGFQPQLTNFTPRYTDVHGLVIHASDLDRRLLSGLAWPAWERQVQVFRARVTDAVIDEAVGRMPPEYRALHGAWLAEALRARRDSLPAAARAHYALLATEVDVHTTDADEVARVERHADGSVEVRVHTGAAAERPHFQRRFLPGETREVRLFLHGGDDRAVVRGGSAGGILVRVVGGGGDDVLADSSRVSGGRRTVFYDARGDNRIDPGTGAKVDTRAWEEPEREGLFGNPPAPRDWGSGLSPFTPTAEWRTGIGPVVGGGPSWTRYGFRRRPYAQQLSARVLWAPLHTRFAVEAQADRVRTGSRGGTRVLGRASALDFVNFGGFGNLASAPERVGLTRMEAAVRSYGWIGRRTLVEAGPEVRWTDPEGAPAYAQAGAAAGLTWDARDDARQPRSGAWLRLRGRGYGADEGAFGGADAEARTYLSAGEAGPTLALRGGAIGAFGAFPFPEAAYVGGQETLRGWPTQRFAGDAALYGGAELRQRIAQVNLGLVRGRLGAMALGDAGRVYVEGRSPGGWHTGVGGGLWFETLGRVVSAALVHGDGWRLHLALGPQF